MLLKQLLLLFGVGGVFGTGVAPFDPGDRRRVWTPQSLPNPVTQPSLCGLERPGRVCDPDGILEPKTRAKIQDFITVIERNCTHPCGGEDRGYQLAVVMLGAMDRRVLPGDKIEAARKFASDLGDHWGVGNKECDDGIVLLASRDDRVAYIKTARGAASALPDPIANEITSRMADQIRKTHGTSFDEAMVGGTALILAALRGEALPTPWDPTYLIVLGFVLAYACVPCLPFVFAGCYVTFMALLVCLLYPFAFLLDGGTALWKRTSRACFPAPQVHEEDQAEQERAEAALRRIQAEMENDEEESSMCSVCLEEMPVGRLPASGEAKEMSALGQISRLSCGHVFHTDCIAEWVDSKPRGEATCPLCRQPISSDWRRGGDHKEGKESKGDRLTSTQRLTAMLERLQDRYPRFGGGRDRWRPADAARDLENRSSQGCASSYHNDSYRYAGTSDWLLFFALTRPSRYDYGYGAGFVESLPSLSNAVSSANEWATQLHESGAFDLGSGSGGGSGSSFGGGGGFSGGGGGGAGW